MKENSIEEIIKKGEDYIFGEEAKKQIEDAEKLKDLKALYSGAVQAGETSIANIIKSGIDLIEKLKKENEELKSDIANMYDEEVVISIISDNFNLSRNEVLALLGGN